MIPGCGKYLVELVVRNGSIRDDDVLDALMLGRRGVDLDSLWLVPFIQGFIVGLLESHECDV